MKGVVEYVEYRPGEALDAMTGPPYYCLHKILAEKLPYKASNDRKSCTNNRFVSYKLT